MGGFIGQMAGILMIILIVVLLKVFIYDLGVSGFKKADFLNPAIMSIGVAFAYIIAGGIVYNFCSQPANILSVNTVWSFGPFTDDAGGFSLFTFISDLFARILFGKQEECRLYLSLICGTVTGVSTSVMYKKLFAEDVADNLFMLFMCVPGIMYVFLPSPVSMLIMFFSLALLAECYDKNVLALIFSVFAVMASIAGIVVVAVCMINIIFKTDRKKIIVADAVSVIIIHAINIEIMLSTGRGDIREYWFILIPVIVPLFGILPIFKKHFYSMLIISMAAVLSGFYFVFKFSYLM